MADNRALLNLLIQTSTKARRGGGGRGPGSRGGKFWLNANGKVEYGPKPSGARSTGHAAPKAQPKGQRAVARPTHGGSGRAKVGELRPGYRIKPQTSAGKLQGKKRMLSEMDKVIRTGKDPHGNALSPSSLAQLRFLATGLRTEISMGGKKEITAKAKAPSKTDAKIAKVMGEYKKGTLNTGSPKGPKVTNPKQAIAIALSQAAKVGKKGATYPLMPLSKPDPTRQPGIPQVPTGVMVALRVPRGIGEAIAVPGGESIDDLHLTLAYLGDDANGMTLENKKLVFDALDDFYRTAKPLSGEISGTGIFKNGAYYASFDSPDLAAFRDTLLGCLSFHGITPISNHGFTPHITLAYLQPDSPLPQASIPKLPITFNELELMWGEQPFGYMLDKDNLKPGEAAAWVNTFDRGLDATSKEVKHKETDPGGSFTVFKDTKGAWRWVAVSSSGFQDRDGETVSTKALAEDAARCDATGSYGPLDWWHTDVVIGNCDFNAMHGKLLVESGTFNNPLVAQRLAQAIARKEFEAGISLQFRHREPGPHVLPGRVFKNIYKERRALLPMDAASNIATRLEVISPATTGQKSIEVYKVDAIKEQKLIELFGQDVAKEYLSKLAQKEQEFIQAGTAYKAVQVEMAEKAAAALDAPMGAAAMNAAPMAQDKPKVAKKDDLEGMLEPGGDNPTEDMAEGEGEGSDYEDSPTDQEADAILETLFTRIGEIVNATVKAKVDEILSAVNGLGAAATKEVAAYGVLSTALKENTAALTKVTGENTALKEKVTALETRVAALDGSQPAAVRARASQVQGYGFKELTPDLQKLVNKETQDEDPYISAAGNFLKGWGQQ